MRLREVGLQLGFRTDPNIGGTRKKPTYTGAGHVLKIHQRRFLKTDLSVRAFLFRVVPGQTIPCAIIALATLMNPATLAPFT